MGETAANRGGRKWWRRIVVAVAGVLVAVVLAGFLLCWFLGIRSTLDLHAYRGMMAARNPGTAYAFRAGGGMSTQKVRRRGWNRRYTPMDADVGGIGLW